MSNKLFIGLDMIPCINAAKFAVYKDVNDGRMMVMRLFHKILLTCISTSMFTMYYLHYVVNSQYTPQ
jgi:hypothetical protein